MPFPPGLSTQVSKIAEVLGAPQAQACRALREGTEGQGLGKWRGGVREAGPRETAWAVPQGCLGGSVDLVLSLTRKPVSAQTVHL